MDIKIAQGARSSGRLPGPLDKLPGRKYVEGEMPSLGRLRDEKVSILLGNVETVDTDRMEMKILLTYSSRTGNTKTDREQWQKKSLIPSY